MKIPFINLAPTSSHLVKLQKIKNKLIKLLPSFDIFGSIAKGTFIKNHKELDLFFKGPSLDDTLDKIKEALSSKVFKKVILKNKGHPYYTAVIRYLNIEWTLDLVPYVGVAKASDVERSMLHVAWVKQKIENKELKTNDVLFLKYLFKKYLLYGAESKVEGFSGYALEVLCHKVETLKDIAQKIRTKTVVDPCDSNRNLLASVSENNINRSIYLLENYQRVKKQERKELPKGKLYCYKTLKLTGEYSEQRRNRIKKFIKKISLYSFYITSFWDFEKQILYLFLRNNKDYYNITKSEIIESSILSKVNNQFYTKNRGSFHLSNIDNPRIIRQYFFNLQFEFEKNLFVRISSTKELKNRFYQLLMVYD